MIISHNYFSNFDFDFLLSHYQLSPVKCSLDHLIVVLKQILTYVKIFITFAKVSYLDFN